MNVLGRIAGCERALAGMLSQRRFDRERLDALERGQKQLEQAMLEIDAALRRSGAHSDGPWALSLLPSDDDPDRQSADRPSTLST